MNKINNSEELLKLIKAAAKAKKNWNKSKDKLLLYLAVEVRHKDDAPCAQTDFKHFEELKSNELLFSQ